MSSTQGKIHIKKHHCKEVGKYKSYGGESQSAQNGTEKRIGRHRYSQNSCVLRSYIQDPAGRRRMLNRDMEVIKTPNQIPRDAKYDALYQKQNEWH